MIARLFAAIVLLLTTEARLVLPGVLLIASLLKTTHVCVALEGAVEVGDRSWVVTAAMYLRWNWRRGHAEEE
eukprot:scaffold4361_cov143-Skeletonema_marinoi.AAC.4